MNKRSRAKVLIGNIFEDALGTATDVAEGVADVFTSAVDIIPGSEIVTGPLGDFAKGPLKDFANTGVGETLLRSFSVAASLAFVGLPAAVGGIAMPWVGSALAASAVAIPGLARGEKFDEALVKEFVYRVGVVLSMVGSKLGEEAAKQLGPVMSQQLTKAVEGIKEKFPGLSDEEVLNVLQTVTDEHLDKIGLSPAKLAARLDIREDVAAYALAWARRDEAMLARIPSMYDPLTGKNRVAASIFTTDPKRIYQMTTLNTVKAITDKPITQYAAGTAPRPVTATSSFDQSQKELLTLVTQAGSVSLSQKYQAPPAPEYTGMVRPPEPEDEAPKSHTMLYAGLGVGAAALGGLVWYMLRRRR